MGRGFGKYGDAKAQGQVLKNWPRVKGVTGKREKDMFKNYARSARTSLSHWRRTGGERGRGERRRTGSALDIGQKAVRGLRRL